MAKQHVEIDINTNELIEKIEAQLELLKKPSEAVTFNVNGVSLDDYDSVEDLIDLRIETRKKFEVRKAEYLAVSKIINYNLKFETTKEEIEIQLKAIDLRINQVVHQEKIATLEEMLKLAKEARTEAEKKATEEADRKKTLLKLQKTLNESIIPNPNQIEG